MRLTERQTAHMLAALRLSQIQDVSAMPHFDDGISPLSDAEIDDLCEMLNQDDLVASPGAGTTANADQVSPQPTAREAERERATVPRSAEPEQASREAPRSSKSAALPCGALHPYTVVGLYPDSDWDGSMHDASFVYYVEAVSPLAAASAARDLCARIRANSWDDLDEETLQRETADYASKTEILSVFEDHNYDRYDPQADVANGGTEQSAPDKAKPRADHATAEQSAGD